MKKINITALRKSLKQKQTTFAENIGIGQSYLSEIENGKKSISDEVYNSLIIKFGEEYISKFEINSDTYNLNNNNSGGVPYFEDIESTGGIMEMYNDYKETPAFYINYEHFNDCTAYLQHVGDSMYPKFCAGEIIAYKRIFNFDVVLWGEAYLVVTNELANNLRTVKLVFQHEDSSKIILRASNPNFKGDTVINKSDIVSMFIVKGKITRSQL